MDLLSLLRILVRRWMIFIPMLALTVACAYALSSSVKPDYEATAVVLLIGTGNPSATGENNPLEDLRPLNITAQALAIIMSDESVRQDLSDQGFDANYQVSVETDTPILALSARTGVRSSAIASRDALVDLLQTSLEAQQRNIGAPSARFITAQTISSSPGARPIHAARDRTLFGVLALGLAASVAAAVSIDQLLAQRSASRSQSKDKRSPSADGTNPSGAVIPSPVNGDASNHRSTPEDDIGDPLAEGDRSMSSNGDVEARPRALTYPPES